MLLRCRIWICQCRFSNAYGVRGFLFCDVQRVFHHRGRIVDGSLLLEHFESSGDCAQKWADYSKHILRRLDLPSRHPIITHCGHARWQMFFQLFPWQIGVPSHRFAMQHVDRNAILRAMLLDFLADNEHDQYDVQRYQTANGGLKRHLTA